MTSLNGQNPAMDTPSDKTRSGERDIAIDYLRAFVIVLVIFLHASLAYTTFSTYDEARWVNSSAPVVDTARWPILDLLVGSLDTFFMPLLFLVSGLFVIPSLTRRGSRGFFVSRLQRLGIPFALGALVLAPWAFLPSYLMAGTKPEAPYLATFFTSDGWPVGPPWFLWILLVFNGIVALVYRIAPSVLAKLRPPKALVILLVTILSFLPLRLIGSHFWWISLGPFDAQPIRLGLYLAYFLLGTALGTGQQWRQKGWPKLWVLWLLVAGVSLFFYMGIQSKILSLPSPFTEVLDGITFAVSCTGASLGCLGAFRRFVRKPNPVFDSLGVNSFSIYLVHYGVVLWIQFALLSAPWPAWIKFSVAFVGGLTLSWGASILVRKVPAVRRVL